MDIDSMTVNTPQGVFMVAERAVGLAVGDLRAELGAQLNEVKNNYNVLTGEIDTLRENIQNAFNINDKTLRADISKAKDVIVEDLADHLKGYNEELEKLLKVNTDGIDKKLIENDEAPKKKSQPKGF